MQAKRINKWLTELRVKKLFKRSKHSEMANEDGSITAKNFIRCKFKLEILK